MKHLIMIAIFVVTLASCTSHKNAHNVLTKKPEMSVETNSESMNVNHLRKSQRVIIPEDSLIYQNEVLGYQITFPENWLNNYVITEYENGEVCIGFFGQSKTGQIAYKDSLRRDGLDLGWIVTEEPEEGSLLIGKIGEIDGVEYFLTSPRGGVYVTELEAISISDSTTRNLAKYTVDETELQLAAQDLKKALAMRDDLYDINIKLDKLTK